MGALLMCFGGGGGAAEDIAQAQRSDEVARQNRIKQGMAQIDQVFGAFDPAFYQKRADAYMAYASPQIEQQQADARKQLIYALARTGNLDSSAANEKSAELVEEGNQERINAANEALNQENALRNQVENTRGNVVAELNATGDAEAASNSALRASQNLNQPAGFSPLGNLFMNFLSTVAGIGSRAGNGYSGFVGSPSLFGPSSGSSRVVGA